MDERQFKVHFQYPLQWANCSSCHRGVFDSKEVKNSFHQYAVWAKDDGEKWYIAGLGVGSFGFVLFCFIFSQLSSGWWHALPFHCCWTNPKFWSQNWNNFTILPALELRLIHFLHLFVLWCSSKVIYTSLTLDSNCFNFFGPQFQDICFGTLAFISTSQWIITVSLNKFLTRVFLLLMQRFFPP